MNIDIVDFEVEELESFDDDYVYDLEMLDSTQPWFFANNILLHNSIYIAMKLFEDCGINLKSGDKISDEFYTLCDKFETYLNDGMNAWSEKSLKSRDSRFVFKRESICDSVAFVSGKNYVLHILDDEGIPVDKFKYKGVSVVRTTMPKVLKPYVKKIIETMVITQSMAETNKAFIEAYEIFKGLGVESIYQNCTMNQYEKHKPRMSGYTLTKGLPAIPNHVGAAHFHDTLVDELGISNKYPKFKSGDKVKKVYLKTPNRYGISVIGFKGKYPKEFSDIFEIDYELMFGKLLYNAIETFYKSVNWKLRKPNENLKIELEDFLVNMNINEAYCKGLNDAESLAVVKLSNALLGNDDGPFNNPQMEDVRQKILNYKPTVIIDKNYNYIIDLILEKELNMENLSEIDKTIVDILNFCKEVVGPKPRSRVSVKAKKFLAKLEVDLINNNVKL